MKKISLLLLTVVALLVALAAGPVYGGNHKDGPASRPPKVSITNPADGVTFGSGDAIDFDGTASDKEDGDVTASLVWTSSINGQIGIGGSISIATLSDGDHTITASVTDSGGKTGSDFITIHVGTQSSGATPRSLILTVTLDRDGRDGDPPIYFDGDTVKIRADVTDDKGPVKGVTVYYKFTTAYGGLLECTIRTQKDRGYTVCSYRVNSQQHGVGPYEVVVTASKLGYKTPDPVTVTFRVE